VRETAAARVYAETLLEVAREQGRVDALAEEAEALRAVLRGTPELVSFLASPRVERERKKAVLRDALSGRVSDMMVRFLEVVVDREREDLLDTILAELETLIAELRNEQPIEVTSAVPLEDSLRERLRETFARATGRRIVLRELVDPALMGGVVVQIGDMLIDGSVRTRLQNLRERLLRASQTAVAPAAD
jgi:F-type H+-transporting ATPase subunit delta